VSRPLVYIAHPLGRGPDREENRKRASRWVAWAAEQGVAPVAPWITLSGEWSEDRREEGLEIDLAVVERCDELWAVGPRISPGMSLEVAHARFRHIPVRDLTKCDEAHAAMWVRQFVRARKTSTTPSELEIRDLADVIR